MVTSMIRKLAGKALLAGALGLSALGSAQATLVVGVWDPVYDAVNFPNLGWRGKVIVDAPPACLAQLGPVISSTALAPCNPATIIQAKVELYDTTQFGEPTLEVLDFTSAFLGVTDIGIASPGVILGIATGPSSPVSSTINLAKYLGVSADFVLDFDVTLLGPDITLSWSTPGFSGVNQIKPEILYFVPEPAGLALAGLALTAMGWTRRRRAA